MKKSAFFLSLLLLSGICASAQITVRQVSLKDPSMNILYAGADNVLEFKGLPENCVVKYNGLAVDCDRKDNVATAHIMLDSKNKGNATVQVFQKNKEIYKKEFTIKVLNGPVVNLGIVKDSVATVSQILAAPYLDCTIPDCFLNSHCTLITYSIAVCKKGDISTHRKTGRGLNRIEFDREIKDEIALLKKGDKIVFDDIKATLTDDQIRTLRDVTVKIQ